MPPIERQYEYKTKWATMLMCSGFFALLAAFFVYQAAANEDPLVINGIVRLSPAGGRVFFRIMALVSVAFVACTALMLVMRLTTTLRIAITREWVILPTGRWWQHHETEVPFEAITALKTLQCEAGMFLYIYADGLRYTVMGDMLPTRADFDDLVSILASRMPTDRESHRPLPPCGVPLRSAPPVKGTLD